MICPECEVELVDNAVFCHECGKRVAGGTPKRSRRRRQDDADPNLLKDASIARRFRQARRRIQSLTPDDEEIELWSGTFSAKGMINYWIFAILVTILLPIGAYVWVNAPNVLPVVVGAVVIMWIVLGGILLFQKLDVHYELSNQRLIHRVGIVRRITNRIEVIDIDDVTFEQGIIERLLGVGSISIFSSDRTDPSITMAGIDDVFEVAQLIDEARRAERVRRGLHIEAV